MKPIYSIVAREMALGISLSDICKARGLNLESLQRVARGDLFQQEVKRVQGEIEQQIIEKAVEDPVLQKLQALSYRAVTTLSDEMDNYDPELGGSATTRISAADKILNKAGYSGKKDGADSASVIILSLSEAKLNSVKAVDLNRKLIESAPDSVDGHLR